MVAYKGRILCTEDEPDTREMLVYILQQAAYEVDCTESAKEAIQLAKTRSYDLILVDNWMPEIGGDELTREIRTFNISTPILSFTPVRALNLISRAQPTREHKVI